MEQNQIPQEEMKNIVQAGITTAMSEEFKKAYTVHLSIKQNGETAATAFAEMCKSLKQMRDEKLYKELGFDTFENYVENNGDYKFKARQAYTHIAVYEKLGNKFLTENSSAGITKLSLLTQLATYECDDFVKEHDLETESVSQLKAEIAELKPRAEQCSMFEIAKDEAEKRADDAEAQLEKTKAENSNNHDKIQKELNTLRNTVSTLEAENKELKDKPIDVAVAEPSEEDIAKIKAEAKVEAQKDFDKRSLELDEQLKKSYEDKLQSEREKADQEKADLEKKIKAGTTEESKVAFKFYFGEVQSSLIKFVDLIENIEDEELKAKFKQAVKKYLELTNESL